MKKAISVWILLILCGTSQATVSLPIDEREIANPCAVHLELLGAGKVHEYERKFEWSAAPHEAAAFVNTKLSNTVTRISVAPVTAQEYNAVFGGVQGKAGSQVTEAQKAEIDEVRSTLKTRYGQNSGSRQFTADSLEKELKGQAASFVIVIGHNRGGLMQLLDGKSVFLDEIVAKVRPDQRVILISCDSSSYVSKGQVAATVSGRLTYKEAFDVADRISAFITKAGGPVSLGEVQTQLNKDVVRVQRNRKIALFIMKAVCAGGTAILVGLIIRELDPCDGKKESDCAEKK